MRSTDKSMGVNSILMIFKSLRVDELYVLESESEKRRGPKINPFKVWGSEERSAMGLKCGQWR